MILGENMGTKMNLKKTKSKTKGRLVKRLIKLAMYAFVIYLSYNISLFLMVKSHVDITNEEFLRILMKEGNHTMLYQYKPDKFMGKLLKLFTNIDLKNPVTILNHELNGIVAWDAGSDGILSNKEYNDDYKDAEDLGKISEYIKDPNPVKQEEPVVYLYNTHQLENYSMSNLEAYNIKPNVMMTSYMLKEKLNDSGISTMVETNNVSDYLKNNNLKYYQSYKASRAFLNDAIAKYPTLNFFIDIHRDSAGKDVTTKTINNKSYARVLFVVGLENPGYESNLKHAQELHNRIEDAYPGLSRGIVTKKGKGVDGIYNQDVNPNIVLLECGGPENTIEEVMNTTEIFSEILIPYLKETVLS